jgi:exosortase/archaeosortase family protein|tara:strand:- start:696 stop:1241 length:546 start_codon:yes stop_codon:yes gene_type:complete
LTALDREKGNHLIGFILKAFCFYTVWQILYDLVLLPDGRLDEFLALSVVSNAKNFLTILGWNIYSLDRLLYIEGYKSVEILNGCNALTLMALYSGFIVSFNGTFVNRAKFLLIGVFAIYVLNVVRIMSFSIATVYFQHYWNLFHEFSPFLFFYPIVLYLWYQWTIVGQNNPTPSYSDLSLS